MQSVLMQHLLQNNATMKMQGRKPLEFRSTKLINNRRYSFGKRPSQKKNHIRLRSSSKRAKSIQPGECSKFSKFYVKNFFEKQYSAGTDNKWNQLEENQFENLSTQQDRRSQKIIRFLKSSKNEKQLSSFFISAKKDTREPKNQLIEQENKQKVKQLQLQSRQNDKIKIEVLQRQNQLMKQELALFRSSQKYSLKAQLQKALCQIQQLQKQLISTKKELQQANQELKIVKRRCKEEQATKQAKKHKIKLISQKYKGMVKRIKELNETSQQQQKCQIYKSKDINKKQKTVIILQKCV